MILLKKNGKKLTNKYFITIYSEITHAIYLIKGIAAFGETRYLCSIRIRIN